MCGVLTRWQLVTSCLGQYWDRSPLTMGMGKGKVCCGMAAHRAHRVVSGARSSRWDRYRDARQPCRHFKMGLVVLTLSAGAVRSRSRRRRHFTNGVYGAALEAVHWFCMHYDSDFERVGGVEMGGVGERRNP